MMRFRKFYYLLSITWLSSCAPVANGVPFSTAHMQPSQGNAKIIVYRPADTVETIARLESNTIGSCDLQKSGFYSKDTKPHPAINLSIGIPHASAEDKSRLTFSAESGKTYYIRVYRRDNPLQYLGLLGYGLARASETSLGYFSMELTDEKQALEYLQSLKQSENC